MWQAIKGWFQKSTVDDEIILFFTPMMHQVRDAALKAGKGSLEVGLKILTDAALGAVTAGLAAPPGTNVAVAEAAFIGIIVTEGIQEIKKITNAEASLIKGAVAIVQTEGVAAVTAAVQK